MKKIIFTLIFMLPSVIFAQFIENFSNNSFLENENVFGTKERFYMYESGDDYQLRLADPVYQASQAYISMPSEVSYNAEWQLYVKINNATSSGNYVRFYLMSDTSALNENLNGYYIMVGNTLDEISLYKQKGNTRTEIISGTDKRIDASAVRVTVKVTRDEDGNWELFSKLDSESDFLSEGTCNDIDILKSKYSGILATYSASNNNSYFFDDWQVSGEKYVKPELNADDIVFSELMVKPAPAVSFLPENEYIEIYNRSDKKINLSGFHLADNSRKYTIDNCIIQPHSYLLLCAESKIADFIDIVPNVKGISSLPTLTDGGKLLWLEDDEENVISWVEYSSDWYGSAFKSGGGWSLECIDIDNISNNADNWTASNSENGGTPAHENSVARENPDIIAPKIEKLAISSDKSIDIYFNEPMDLFKISNFEIENLTISHIEMRKPQNKSLTIYFAENITQQNIYEITIKNLTDKSGNKLEPQSIKFAIPETTEPNDVVINELLFHPASGGEKYVELYNRSDKTLDLSALMLSNRKNGELQAGTPISSVKTLLFASEYVLLSANVDTVCEQYACGENAQKINVKPFPSYPIEGGSVVLVARNGTVIDEFIYSEKLHHPMVKNPVGVSLERINPNAATQNADNWHSASFECGYGTPGAKNSQFIDISAALNDRKTVWLAPETFSPDNDGNNDFLNIYYHLGENAYTATIKVYDANGRCVKKLASNVLAESEGVFRWNGENDGGTICNIGIYVVVVEFTKTSGSVKHYKLPCVLSVE
ncbi:MAG: lamin tail domain-containing protein [Prevotellaceae bacterium]|jgi:hypothetical protein|nr:lamin tail domain-containing protein [Prevotellaceae bacterium]